MQISTTNKFTKSNNACPIISQFSELNVCKSCDKTKRTLYVNKMRNQRIDKNERTQSNNESLEDTREDDCSFAFNKLWSHVQGDRNESRVLCIVEEYLYRRHKRLLWIMPGGAANF